MIDLDKLQSIILAGKSATPGTCLVPKDYKLEGTERFQLEPNRLRGCFSTPHIDEWADYCLQHASDSSRTFIDPHQLKAVCRLNHGTADSPEWGDHTALLALTKGPEYAALDALQGKLTQEEMIDFILDWSPALTFTVGSPDPSQPDAATMPVATALQRLRKLETKSTATASFEEQDLKRERSLLESAAVTSDPPGGFFLACCPYDGLSERRLPVRLSYTPTTPPMIKVRVLGAQTIARTLAEEFRRLAVDLLIENGPDESRLHERTHIGNFS